MSCSEPTVLDTFVIDGTTYPAPEVGSEQEIDFGYVTNQTLDLGLKHSKPFLENEIRTYSFINLSDSQKQSLETTLSDKLGLEIAVVTHISESFNVIVLNPGTTFTNSAQSETLDPDPNSCNTNKLNWDVSLVLQRTN